MAWYSAGTVSVTNGSATVTGSGTAWVANAQASEGIWLPDGQLYEIVSINSDTSLTISPNYLGTTQSGQAYRIVPVKGYPLLAAQQMAALISTVQGYVDGALEIAEHHFDGRNRVGLPVRCFAETIQRRDPEEGLKLFEIHGAPQTSSSADFKGGLFTDRSKREAGAYARHVGQARQVGFVNALIVRRVGGDDPEKIVRVAGHQITLHYFRAVGHGLFKGVQALFALGAERNLDEDIGGLADGALIYQRRIAIDNPGVFQ